MTRHILTLSVLFAASTLFVRPAAACAMYIPPSEKVVVQAAPIPTPEVVAVAPVAPQTTLERAMELIDQVIPEAVAAPLPPTALEEAAPTAAAPPAKAAMPTTIAEAQ